jgi:hypothetical protein
MSGWYNQARENRMARTSQKDRAAGTGQLRWDNHGRTAMSVKLGHHTWDMMLAMTLDNPDRLVWTGWPDRSAWTGQAGKDRETGDARI